MSGEEFSRARTVAVNGTSLAYREAGTGEPVVFVHGALSDLRTWTAQLEGTAERHRAIAYSCRYARPNDDVPARVDNQLAPHVEDLAAVLGALDAAPAHLVGNSSGPFICLLSAMRHPELVRTMVLNEPPALTLFVSPQPRPFELLRLALHRPRTASAIARMGAGALAPAVKAFRRDDDEAGMRAFMRGVLGRDHLRRLSEARYRQAYENVSGLKAMLLGSGFPQLADEQVRSVRAPALIVVGEASPPFGRRLAERLEELLPHARRLQVEGASHFTHEDDPAAFSEAMLGFVAGASGSGRAAA